jgi:hypothetical protein
MLVLPDRDPPAVRLNPSTFSPVLVRSETPPVGVPLPLLGATLPDTVTDCPCDRLLVGLRPSVVLVGRKLTVFHLLSKLATFTEPRPVAKS